MSVKPPVQGEEVTTSFAPLPSDPLPPASEKKILLITLLAFVAALFLGAGSFHLQESGLAVQTG